MVLPAAFQKETPSFRMVFLFGAGDEARWRPSRAATRTRAPKHAPGMFLSLRSCPVRASARPVNAKKHHPVGMVLFFGAGDEARWRPCRTATRTRAPKHAPGMFLSLRSCPVRASARPINAKKTPPCWDGVILERATRLELATSTLARSRSTR